MRRTSRILFFIRIHDTLIYIYIYIIPVRVYVKMYITTGNAQAVGDQCPDV